MNYNLDFKNDVNNWFDLWNVHFDNEGKGNEDFKIRKVFLDRMFTEFEKIKSQIQSFSLPYQLWIFIDENDSCYDAIYIHTENPNKSPFPIKLESCENSSNNTELYDYVVSHGYEIILTSQEDENHIYIYDKNFGIPLV